MATAFAARARLRAARAQRSLTVALHQVLLGLRAFGSGLALVVRPPALGVCLESMARAVPVTASAALFLWLLCYPLRWREWYVLTLRDALRAASVAAVALAQLFLAQLSGEVFHVAFRRADGVLAAELKNRPVIRGLRAEAWAFVKMLAAFVFLAMVGAGLAPYLGSVLVPILVAVGAFLAHAWAIALPAALVAALAGWLLGSWYALAQPFLWLGTRVDPAVAILALVAASGLRVLRGASLGSMMKTGSILYYSLKLLTERFLANYSQRLTSEEWQRFTSRHRWRLCGFGLPIFGIVTYAPEVALLLLPAFHGAAAALLADILHEAGGLED